MFEEIVAQTYNNLGFPVAVIEYIKAEKAIVNYPGWGAGFFVIDVDKHYGGLQTFEKLKKHINFPETVTARTQHGGLHLYYKYPNDYSIPTSVNVNIGIDVLSENSQVTMPGTTGKDGVYSWIRSPFKYKMAYPSLDLLKYIGATKI